MTCGDVNSGAGLRKKLYAYKGYSVRNDFPDLWYELSNPSGSSPARINYRSERRHFPPNLANVVIKELFFALITDEIEPLPIEGDISLQYTPDGRPTISRLSNALGRDFRSTGSWVLDLHPSSDRFGRRRRRQREVHRHLDCRDILRAEASLANKLRMGSYLIDSTN